MDPESNITAVFRRRGKFGHTNMNPREKTAMRRGKQRLELCCTRNTWEQQDLAEKRPFPRACRGSTALPAA